MAKGEHISMSVVRRLPRYYRFLYDLKENGIVRISSKELSQRMGLTASQIRQDLNCFGGLQAHLAAMLTRLWLPPKICSSIQIEPILTIRR